MNYYKKGKKLPNYQWRGSAAIIKLAGQIFTDFTDFTDWRLVATGAAKPKLGRLASIQGCLGDSQPFCHTPCQRRALQGGTAGYKRAPVRFYGFWLRLYRAGFDMAFWGFKTANSLYTVYIQPRINVFDPGIDPPPVGASSNYNLE